MFSQGAVLTAPGESKDKKHMSHIDPLHDPENVREDEDFEFNNDEEEPKAIEREQVEDALTEVENEIRDSIGWPKA